MWDYHPVESAEPFLSDTVAIDGHDVSDDTGSPLKYLINLMFCSVFRKMFFRGKKECFSPIHLR